MNKRQCLLKMFGGIAGITSLNGCASNVQSNSSKMVLDNGTTDLTPAYLVTYTEGNPTAFVRADFYLMTERKQVQLRNDGSIRVNEVLLKRDPKELISYIANIPVFNESFNFEFTRFPGQIQRHRFSLPKLNIPSYPAKYRGSGLLEIPIVYEPYMETPEIIRDLYFMNIYAPSGEFRLSADRKDRVEMVFKPSQIVPIPPGFYRARIFRQQRFLLSKMSDSKLGWAVISNGHNFEIEIIK